MNIMCTKLSAADGGTCSVCRFAVARGVAVASCRVRQTSLASKTPLKRFGVRMERAIAVSRENEGGSKETNSDGSKSCGDETASARVRERE